MPTKKNLGNDVLLDRIETKLDLFKEHFDEHIGRVTVRLDKMDERIDESNVVAAKQCGVLEEHVKRTNLLEKKLEEDVGPLKAQGAQIKLMLKIATAILGAGGAGLGIKELIALFTGG